MTEIVLTLPVSAKALWPNARGHWSKKAKAVREARLHAHVEARNALWVELSKRFREPPMWAEAEAWAVFCMPTRRAVDRDNAAASLKATWDGIADAGIVANDSGLTPHPPEMRFDKARPRVELTIREAR